MSADGRSLAQILAENETLRRELDAARRLGGFGSMAGGVAHDFSNVMSVIAGYTELMLRRMAVGDPLRAGAEAIQTATAWGLNLVEHVLAWRRPEDRAGETADLNAVVSGVAGTLGPLLGNGIELVARLGSGVERVRASAGHIEQIVMNLVLNARDAMPAGGCLTVETAGAEFDDPASGVRRAGARLTVSDTGAGMDPATLARVFEPYFTTKPPGKGTGLGLSTVLGLATQHGGRVEAASTPGRGATFTVHLPRAGVAPPRPAGAAGRTVLVVDDEPGVRELIREILELHDYTVLEARDADEALGAAARHAGPIALTIADLQLPGLAGPDVVARLRVERPGLPALFISGDLSDADGLRPVLYKPFSVDALVRAVEEALERPRT